MRANKTIDLNNMQSVYDWLPVQIGNRKIPGQTITGQVHTADPIRAIKAIAHRTRYETFSLRFANGDLAVEVVECIDAGRYAIVVCGEITLSDLTIQELAVKTAELLAA